MSETVSDAAALLTADITDEAMTRGFHVSEDAAAALGAPSSEPQAEPETPPQAEAEPPEDDAVFEFPSFQPVPDDELAELEDDDEDTPPAAQQPAWEEEDDGDDEYVAPEVQDLKRRLAASEKRNQHLETLRAQEGRKSWAKEAERRYPLASLDSIDATSKRAFLRDAARSHQTNYTTLKPHLDKLEEARKQLETQARTDARSEATAAWGRPLTGPGVVPVEASDRNAELEAARATGNLSKVIGVIRKQSTER